MLQQFILHQNKIMKKVLILVICSLLLNTYKSFSQKRDRIEHLQNFEKQQIYWGFYLGYNKKDFKISYNNPNTQIEVEAKPGFTVGLISIYRLNNNFDIRLEPGLSSNTKTLYFNNISGGIKDSVRDIGATYLHIPLLIKFNANRLDNMRPYLIGGISYDFNFSSNQKNPADNQNGEFRMKSHNFMYEIGFGVDLYLPFFVFSPSIRGTFAINNELVDDYDPNSQWTGPIDYFGTRGIFINLAFH